ncbi:predicted protein [Sclerotinia sclerotiorum 1980 UF-70]|uniref:Uncharacterized protein n=1 Tax=Sclerotinia sclerotiorum (strain ATCC 18683 / 1980 / Ss-1) TaxID=665079 RepID=A7ECH4_SCLS1|nr:predicted protein [Sclerotinia sclerotiorum 1980 UF-70]EDO00153.1 predicted protein [Sclerotinia sclerotiorum 1980 UF-70]
MYEPNKNISYEKTRHDPPNPSSNSSSDLKAV